MPAAGKDSAIQTKLRAARSRLMMERPFLGGLVLHLPLREASPTWCESTATDARAIYYNPAYIAWLSFEQLQFILAHEAMHCALGHFSRRSHRNLTRWNVACDYAVNQILVREGLTPPPGILFNREYHDLSAEEIYPLVPPGTTLQTVDRHAYEKTKTPPSPRIPLNPAPTGGGGEVYSPQKPSSGDLLFPANTPLTSPPPPLAPVEQEKLSRLWQQRAAGLAQQTLRTGKLSAPLQRMIGRLGQPQLPWRQLLAQCLVSLAQEDYSFARPSRREGQAILPRPVSRQLDLVAVLDTSGSIRNEQLQSFLTEISAIKGQLQARVILHACDAALCEQGPWIYEPWGALELPATLPGGGDTDFRPPFQWIAQAGLRPHALLYFTDARGEFPHEEPLYPVIWIVKGNAQVPWGRRIQLN